MKKNSVRTLTLAALIAALYVILTLVSNALGLAVGPLEFRFSEALCILPVFTPAAVPGLFCGCLVANLLCGAHILDVIFGSLATLLGAMGTYWLRKRRFLPYLSPVFFNSLIIPPILYFSYGFQDRAYLLLLFFFVLGEVVNAGLLAALLRRALTPFRDQLK